MQEMRCDFTAKERKVTLEREENSKHSARGETNICRERSLLLKKVLKRNREEKNGSHKGVPSLEILLQVGRGGKITPVEPLGRKEKTFRWGNHSLTLQGEKNNNVVIRKGDIGGGVRILSGFLQKGKERM